MSHRGEFHRSHHLNSPLGKFSVFQTPPALSQTTSGPVEWTFGSLAVARVQGPTKLSQSRVRVGGLVYPWADSPCGVSYFMTLCIVMTFLSELHGPNHLLHSLEN